MMKFEGLLSDENIRRAIYQPNYGDGSSLRIVRNKLEELAGVVRHEEIEDLKKRLKRVAAENLFILQAGDCAEPLLEHTAEIVRTKVKGIHDLADLITNLTDQNVIRIGRIAGQYAKPRSNLMEKIDGGEITSFLGELVNDPKPTFKDRQPNAWRMLRAYVASYITKYYMDQIWGETLFCSHEGLSLQYEAGLTRNINGKIYGLSGHLLWIGARTLNKNSPHIEFFKRLANPIGIKISPNVTPDLLDTAIQTLNPKQEEGKLILITRMGNQVEDRLLPLIKHVKSEGYKVLWLCDPMHGNTKTNAYGIKTRLVDDMIYEIKTSKSMLESEGLCLNGLHLEYSPLNIYECAQTANEGDLIKEGSCYTTLCDPRLNHDQACHLIKTTLKRA